VSRAEGTGPRIRKPAAVPSLVISIPSQTSYLGLVRDLTKKMAEAAGFDEATADRLALAVDEATTNVIEHAYNGAADKELEVRIEDRGADFRVDVVDTGAMVDPRALPRVDLERYVTERRTGGLGVHLMEKIMDSVTFRRSARRNVCCLVKRKNGADPGV
jgi:serine/threonine-protein kinase RsbW